jgi:outer membrane protein OmpA-like peptidoglycan-associated protein
MRTALLALLVGAVPTADAQIFDRVKRAAERGAERAVERQVESRSRQATEAAIDAMFDASENAVRCVFTDSACIEGARAGGDDVVLTDRDGAPVDRNGDPVTEANATDAVVRSGGQAQAIGSADANYDFEPGERVLFAEDFSGDNVGDFPRDLYYLGGTAEVVDFQGRRFVRFVSGGAFEVRLGQDLPSTFTLEFDYQGANDGWVNIYTAPRTNDQDARPFYDYEGDYLNVGSWRGSGVWGGDGPKSVVRLDHDELHHIEVTVDEGYVKMYADGERFANIPRADIGRHDAVTFQVGARDDRLVYLGNLRVAAGGNDLYGALESEGRVVTEGVLFDTASATLRPESFAVVQEIAAMLREHPDLRVRIEGHTDNAGDAAANQTLSEERAAAVRAMLVGLGIDASRLESAGLGQTQPVASNDTAEGRAQNRRVELVRL